MSEPTIDERLQRPLWPESYDELHKDVLDALDRDGQHDWDETSRLATVIADALWRYVPDPVVDRRKP